MTVDLALRAPVSATEASAVDALDVDPTTAPDDAFPQSVASGGPTPSGVVLWSRVGPDTYDGTTPLGLRVAGDPDFEDVVTTRRIPADEFGPDHDHTVRIDLDGLLAPDSRYYYRFVYDGTASRTGRCRTLPTADSSPNRLRLGVVSCQHYQNGYFGAYAHLAREDVDFVLHLGDYIYEGSGDQFRVPGEPDYPGRDASLPSGHDVAWSLEDFRALYRTYRSDGFLQRAHERHTFIRAWDDHAIADNRYWDYDADAPVAPNHPRGDDPAFMRRLTADGVRSWWEYTPARVEYDPDADHLHDALKLYRQFRFGDLATLVLTDERLFRSPPPYVDGWTPEWLPASPVPSPADRTMLGDRQREWFLDAVRSAGTRWTAWANEVLSMPFRIGFGPASFVPNADSWDGYPSEREEVFEALAEADNAVTLTGDMHTALCGTQRSADGDPIGVEFMTPAVTSVNIAEGLAVENGIRARVTRGALSAFARAMNPHFDVFDSHHWGYGVVEFTRSECTFTVYSVDKTENEGTADRDRLVSVRVPAGRSTVERQ